MSYVRTRLGRLFFEERGAAKKSGDPAMVLCHSLLFDGSQWNAQIEPLASLGRVIVLDGPGHGKSEAPPRFSIEDHADALSDAFKELGIERAVMVGLSWGGMVTMRLALQHPAMVAGMALLDTSAELEPLHNRLKYRLFISFARRFGVPRELVVREIIPKMFCAETMRARPELVDIMTRRINGFERHGLARANKAVLVHRTNILEKIDRIKAPTLVVCGREDASTPPERSEAIASKIPGAKLTWIEHVAT